jgi:NTE family protein
MVNGRMMADGGLVGHIPASVARMMGAQLVIAVDVNSQHLPIPQPTHLFTVMMQALSIMGRSSVSYLYTDADIVIRPQIDRIRPDDLSKAGELIAAGEEATRRLIPRIKQLLLPRKQGFFKRLFSKNEHDRRRVTMLSGE